MYPLSKLKAKYIKSLQLKKNRQKEERFIVEGEKSVQEFFNSNFTIDFIVGTEEFFLSNQIEISDSKKLVASTQDLSSIGSLKSNNTALAVVVLPKESKMDSSIEGVILALDGINDPGNLGTIIRTADWFGITAIVINVPSVDVYNPKVVNSSKGSLSRVPIYQRSLSDFLKDYKGEIIGADMVGTPLKEVAQISQAVIVMGSESHGISKPVQQYLTQKVTIPANGMAESLNVGVATGIICFHLIAKD